MSLLTKGLCHTNCLTVFIYVLSHDSDLYSAGIKCQLHQLKKFSLTVLQYVSLYFRQINLKKT